MMRTMETADALALGPRLRREDSEELLDNVPALVPAIALDLSRKLSAFAIVWDENGVPIACGGVVDQGDGLGAGWLLAAPEALAHPREFHRRARASLEACADHWDAISACSRSDLVVHHRWLAHLGFEPVAEVDGYLHFLRRL